MADVNISNCTAHPAKWDVDANAISVSFHAADAPYTLYFHNPNTFGMSSYNLAQGGSPTDLGIKSRESTGYCLTGPGCSDTPPCPPPLDKDDDGDPFDIIITSPQPYPKPKPKPTPKPKPKAKKAAVKAKPKAAAKAKAKAKPKPKPKPKSRPKAKSKPKPKKKR